MSVKVMAQVWDSDLPPNHKLVLLAYADAANDDGTHCFPGEERLAQMTGYSVSQIRRITRELIDSGRLIQVKRGYRGQRAEFAIPKGAQSATHSDGKASRKPFAKPSAHASPPIKTRPNTSPNGEVAGMFEAFFEFWLNRPYQPNAWLLKSQRGRINSAVKEAAAAGITADEIRARGERYRRDWPAMERSPQALLTHWARFDGASDPPAPFDPDNCQHPDDRRAVIDAVEYCGACGDEVSHAV